MKRLRLEGQTFGLLKVDSQHGINSHGNLTWLCRCCCGGKAVVTGANLRSGGTRSCGCGQGNLLHGDARRLHVTSEHRAYVNAKNRCNNPRNKNYSDYGGRGIKFLFTSFTQFLYELGRRPSRLHSLDRIRNNGHYRPGNVRWATRKQQRSNQR
jgi:hypothetical protein